MPNDKMDEILDTLQQARQRATYGAVAAIVGSSPRTLMAGRDRDMRHSWVVSRRSGQPTATKRTRCIRSSCAASG
jgi:hypothetical protein